jgi:MYXO-CTERM domain-containing protein
MPRGGAVVLSRQARRGRRVRHVRRIFAIIAAAVGVAGVAFAQTAPTLVIDAPAELAAARSRLESYDLASLSGIMRMVGLDAPGPRIHVILAPEDSAAAKTVSPSTAGFAISQEGLIVIFPARSPIYPHDSLEDVLRHEVAHVLISRAARGHPVPRWFHEGLAMAAERPWAFADRSRLILELVAGPRLTVDDIDRLFDTDATRPRAYALAAAMVREIIRAHGAGAPAAILRAVPASATFDEAMVRAVNRPMRELERDFWERQRVWTVWVPMLTSSEVLWLAVIALAALAVWQRRRRAAAIRRRWDEEDAAAASRPPPNEPGGPGGD